MFVDKKLLNHTLAIESPFQTIAVGLLVEFIDSFYHCALQKCFPRRVNQGFSYIMHTLLFVRMDDTSTHTNASVSIEGSKNTPSCRRLQIPDNK